MTLDEAIKHCEEVADGMTEQGKCTECANEHKQLAEWLKELKQLKVQQSCEDVVSRQAVLNIDFKQIMFTTANPMEMIRNKIKDLPSVMPKGATVTDSVDKFKEIDFKTIKNGKFVNDKE